MNSSAAWSIGEKEMTGEDEAEVDAYFAPDFRFHGPDRGEWDYQGLKEYFTALRAAFDNLTISRGIVVVEGIHVACQTTITGTFVREFTHSPVGPLPPTGNRRRAGNARPASRTPQSGPARPRRPDLHRTPTSSS
jgi:hypothetical protein